MAGYLAGAIQEWITFANAIIKETNFVIVVAVVGFLTKMEERWREWK